MVKQQFQILPQEDIPMSVTLSKDMFHSDNSDPLASMTKIWTIIFVKRLVIWKIQKKRVKEKIMLKLNTYVSTE